MNFFVHARGWRTDASYDITDFPNAPTYLATYSWEKPAMEATARVLFGQTDPKGKLPATAPSSTPTDTA
ncbi:hypothetical protein [Nonomuraea cypriaca]|uniref:hypothetical protein n=1 Tax=Nonomuraea cypriaca TaxID=1187855 RepID=UPI0018A80F47|nr:hypothetical protein [Nonomuraea cypriaca]